LDDVIPKSIPSKAHTRASFSELCLHTKEIKLQKHSNRDTTTFWEDRLKEVQLCTLEISPTAIVTGVTRRQGLGLTPEKMFQVTPSRMQEHTTLSQIEYILFSSMIILP